MPPKMPFPPMPIQKSKGAPNKAKTKAKAKGKLPKMPLAGNPAVGMPPVKKGGGKKLPPMMNPMLGGM